MSEKVKSSLIVQLLKLFAAFLIAWMLILLVFSIVTPTAEDGTIPEKYNSAILCVSIVLAFLVNMVMDYNSIQHLKSYIAKTRADIVSVNETSALLIDKAERVTDKYLNSETGLYEKFAEARKGITKIRNSSDFKAVLESYPELKANIHTQKLLSQLESTQNAKLLARTAYSSAVVKYNAKIHTFPIVLIRKACKWEDEIISDNLTKEELVTDEELGI